jgi:hypothetical protein
VRGASRSTRNILPKEIVDDSLDHTPMNAAKAKVPPTPSSKSPIGSAVPETTPSPVPGRPPASALLEPYMRQSQRVEVDWIGSLRGSDGIRPVRIFEVSSGGAVVQTAQSLELGQELTLVFEHIPMQPQAPVKVIRRATMGFVVEGDIPSSVTSLAAVPSTGARRLAG